MTLDYKKHQKLFFELSKKYGLIETSPNELLNHIANLVSNEICGDKCGEHEYASMIQDYRMLVETLKYFELIKETYTKTNILSTN